mgnify:CR=1 FL=1
MSGLGFDRPATDSARQRLEERLVGRTLGLGQGGDRVDHLVHHRQDFLLHERRQVLGQQPHPVLQSNLFGHYHPKDDRPYLCRLRAL